MTMINMLDAKSQLSKLVDAVERGVETEIIIARNGRPAARLVPLAAPGRTGVRIGLAEGLFQAPRDPREQDAEVAELFSGNDE